MSTPTCTTTGTTTGTAVLDLADTVVMTLLHDHVPLALLCDLTLPDGPTSAAILAAEGEPETRWWER